MVRLVSALFAASMMLAAPLTALPAQAAPVAFGAAQAGLDTPMVEKAHSARWRAIARSGTPYYGRGFYRGRGRYGRGYGRGYGRPYGRGYGRPYRYHRGW
jgi:hypothetical protein